MKKKILAVAITLAALAGIPAVAQNNADNNQPKKECCKDKKECSKDKKECCKEKCDKGQQAGKCDKQRKQMNPFEGIVLTENQQAQLDQLREKRMAARQAKVEARKAEKQNRDSVNVADRKAEAKAYLDEVKAILTPEQYTQFLENMYVAGGQHKGDKGKAFNQGKQGQKGDRPQGAPNGKPGKGPKGQKNG